MNNEYISKAEAEAKFQSKDEAKEDRHELKTLITKSQLEISEISKENAIQTEQFKMLSKELLDHMNNEDADRKTLLGILNELRTDHKERIEKVDTRKLDVKTFEVWLRIAIVLFTLIWGVITWTLIQLYGFKSDIANLPYETAKILKTEYTFTNP